MAILHVASLGQPVLRQEAKPVDKKEIQSQSFQDFLDDLIESMRFHQGVGLAAPQVFRSQRVVAVEVPPGMDDGGQGLQADVFINPRLTAVGEGMESDWEGCLSLKDLRGVVPRHKEILLQALDRRGKAVELRLKGFCARVFQHEVDHLDGIVFLDRMEDLGSLGFARDLACSESGPSEPPDDG